MPSDAPQHVISAACEEDLRRYGDSFRGVGYTHSAQEALERYRLMLGVIRERDEPVTLLDLGCGLAHLCDVVKRLEEFRHLRYTGLDISDAYVAGARARHPEAEILLMDILEDDRRLPTYDYVVLNGLFNYRGPISHVAMQQYWQQVLSVAYRHSRRGLAFNVMSTIVDWERDDLFHLPFDTMAAFIGRNLSRHFVVRHDYQAYEYTTYVYRDACHP